MKHFTFPTEAEANAFVMGIGLVNPNLPFGINKRFAYARPGDPLLEPIPYWEVAVEVPDENAEIIRQAKAHYGF
jgi:hypothetical protein